MPVLTKLSANVMTDIIRIGPVMPYPKLIMMTPAPTSPLGHIPTLSAKRSLNVASDE